MSKPKHPILIVEDGYEDYVATVRALRKSKLANPIHNCADGDDALDYLFRNGKYTDPDQSPRPILVLVDLNLPGTDGWEVMKRIKVDDTLKTIPVIIVTTSSDEKDIQKCYEAGANSYIQKPVDLDRFVRAIQLLHDYWFEIVVLPKED